MEYSYFIKRNIKFFNNNGYTLYPNGNQMWLYLGKCIRELFFVLKSKRLIKK